MRMFTFQTEEGKTISVNGDQIAYLEGTGAPNQTWVVFAFSAQGAAHRILVNARIDDLTLDLIQAG